MRFALAAPPTRGRSWIAGFTLIELLTVLAVIGLLTGILIPTTTTAHRSAQRARTKVQFGQWLGAMEQFRQEYGYYPPVDGGSGGRLAPDFFAGTLTGLALNGGPVVDPSHLGGNSHLLRFYAIGEGELNAERTQLVDGFGNTDIAVIYDRNGDGLVNDADGEAVAVRALDGAMALAPAATDLNLAVGLHAGVIFYSAGQGMTAADLVFSWR